MKLTREFLDSMDAVYDASSGTYSLHLPSLGVWLMLSSCDAENSRWAMRVTKTGLGDPSRAYRDIQTVEEVMGLVFAAGFDIGKEHIRDAVWCLLKPANHGRENP